MLLALAPSLILVVVGVVFFVLNLRRYRRTRESAWLVLTVTAALIAVVAVPAMAVHLVRH